MTTNPADEPAALAVDGDPKDDSTPSASAWSAWSRDELLVIVERQAAEVERLTKLAKANGDKARFWGDHFAEIEQVNRDAFGPHHKPGYSVAELITALVGELAETREFGNDAMDKAQETAKWIEGYGKLSADNKRLTRERDEAVAEIEAARGVVSDHIGDRMPPEMPAAEGVQMLVAEIKDLGRVVDEELDERDAAVEWADKLALAIAPVEQIGEHTSANRPWANALEIAESRPAIPVDRPRVVCLCGSMRFEEEIREAAREESIAGHIVVLPLCNMKQPHPLWNDEATAERLKASLDALHKAKIDLADEIVAVSDASGYVGDSTRSEIAYAEAHGKPVRYWPAPPSGSDTTEDGGDRG